LGAVISGDSTSAYGRELEIEAGQTVTARDWWVALIVALVATLLLTLPYGLGHYLARPGTVYTGLLINVEDGSYLSAIEQGRSGSWGYRNLFTTETAEPAFIQGFYLALGQLARVLGLSTVTMWHLALVITNLILFLTVFAFAAFNLPSRSQRQVAYLLALSGAGFDLWRFPDWFERTAALDAVPVTLRMPEAHLFFGSLTYPHFGAGITLVIAVLWLSFLALTQAECRWLWVVLAGAANLLLAVVYPFLIFLITAVLGLFYLYRTWRARRILWSEAARLAVVFAIPLPLFLYYQAVLAANPVMRMWNAQAVTLSPNPLHYLLTYAPYLLLALPAVYSLRQTPRPQQERRLFLCFWLIAVAVMLYLPLNPQRRFVQGVQVPLAILAASGLSVLMPRILGSQPLQALFRRPRYTVAGMRRLLLLLIVGLTGMVNIYFLAGAYITLAVVQPYPFFRPESELQAMQWLKENSTADEVVLAAYWSGSYIPFYSGNRVVVGQRYETVHFADKRQDVERFFSDTADAGWRRQFLRDQGATFVFVGPAERELGPFAGADSAGLELVYANNKVLIYRFTEEWP
jgi:hypothetical protein